MLSLTQTRWNVAWGLVLVWAGLAGARAATEADPPAPWPVPVDRKTASTLALTQTRPEYPTLARINYIQGRVRMQVVVTREGRVSEAHVVAGHPFLAVSALEAVRRWRYRPFRTSSGPTEFLTVVEMNFVLHGKRLERMPPQAEQDLDRQVRPPEIVVKSAGVVPAVPVRLRVLVGDDGRALDARLLTNSSSRFDDAWRQVKHWKFRPARWGSLAVPWYLDVEVPLEDWSHAQAASDSWGR